MVNIVDPLWRSARLANLTTVDPRRESQIHKHYGAAMTPVRTTLIETIEQQRRNLFEEAKAIADDFMDDTKPRSGVHTYSPLVSDNPIKGRPTYRIAWRRGYLTSKEKARYRHRIDGTVSRNRKQHETLVRNKTGPLFDARTFPKADNDLLSRIFEAECKLAPLREELALLGKLLGTIKKTRPATVPVLTLRNEAA
jgi:hypothetical protein